jgi:ABC-type branched-subunit amino acid transport system substrate-binding protein
VSARSRAALVALLGASLIAASCGGGSGGGDNASTAATVDPGVKAGIAQALGGGSTSATGQGQTGASGPASTSATAKTDAQPTTMDQWEALWARQRADIVKRIKDNHWGKSADGTKVTGPEGFTIDLTKCPPNWSDTEGVSDTEVKIGATGALSGPQADYGNIMRGGDALMQYYGKKGAFKDSTGKTRKVTVEIRDDAYDPARAIPLVDELIDSVKVFAMTTQQSAASLKTYDKLNQRCIPQPLAETGHPAMGDPVNHPWTTGSFLAYNTEAVLWGSFIEQHLAEFGGKAKVAALITTNDFGAAYDSGFRAYLAQSAHKADIEYITEKIEPTASNVTDPMTTLAAQKPNVFIAGVVGTPCSQVTTEAAQNGMKDAVKYKFLSGVCKASSFVGKDKVGDASDGWWVMGGGQKDINSPAYDNDAFVVWARQVVDDAGYDHTKSGSFGSGMFYYWGIAQALQIAGDLDGGLTRTNFVVAQRAMDMTHPWLLPGIKFNLNGDADAYFVEGSDISQWSAEQQAWVQQGPDVDLSGKSKNCSWDPGAAACR